MRTFFLSFLGLSSVVALATAGCGFSGGDSGSDFEGGSGGGSAAAPAVEPPIGGSSASTGAGSTQNSGGAGTLTAGDWDDNLNFGLFRTYVEGNDGNSQATSFESADRVVITVTADDGAPLSNAQVLVAAPGHSYLTAPTGTDGRVLFFPAHDGVTFDSAVTITVNPPAGQDAVQPVSVPLAKTDKELTIKLPGAQKALPSALDLAFVIDATGSMSDEIQYLKAEVAGIAEGVKSKFANVSIQYSLIVYRDVGDEYVTRSFGFTPELSTFTGHLAQQSADGGGDFPEAMDQAMGLVPQLQWRPGNVARMAFLVADAPPHQENIGAMFKAMNALRPQGIRLYPVAASGVDPEAEYVMRVSAEATLGRYLFLTDDSGVGGSHAEPHIPCYQVQKLNTLIGRMISSELTGTRVPASPDEIIRAVGDPKAGVCKLQGGGEAYL